MKKKTDQLCTDLDFTGEVQCTTSSSSMMMTSDVSVMQHTVKTLQSPLGCSHRTWLHVAADSSNWHNSQLGAMYIHVLRYMSGGKMLKEPKLLTPSPPLPPKKCPIRLKVAPK